MMNLREEKDKEHGKRRLVVYDEGKERKGIEMKVQKTGVKGSG